MAAQVEAFELDLDETASQLVQLARADGPLFFRDADQDPDERNRAFAELLGVRSFLGTPLVTKGRIVGILAVDNGLTGRDVQPGDGPLLYTVGSLIAAGIDNARLFAELADERSALERRVAERTADLVDARAAAEAATVAKSHFLSSVSHELRTPLTSVVGFSKLISRRLSEVVFPTVATDDPKVERAMRQVTENLAIIVEEGNRLTTLINDTLDLAKIEAGRFEWRDDEVDIAEVIGRATAATASLLDIDGGPHLVLELADDLPTGPRRPRPPHPGRHQPRVERGQVHADGHDHHPGDSARTTASASTSSTRASASTRRIRTRCSSHSGRPATPCPRPRAAPASACPSAARSSSTMAAACGSRAPPAPARPSRSACPRQQMRPSRRHPHPAASHRHPALHRAERTDPRDVTPAEVVCLGRPKRGTGPDDDDRPVDMPSRAVPPIAPPRRPSEDAPARGRRRVSVRRSRTTTRSAGRWTLRSPGTARLGRSNQSVEPTRSTSAQPPRLTNRVSAAG